MKLFILLLSLVLCSPVSPQSDDQGTGGLQTKQAQKRTEKTKKGLFRNYDKFTDISETSTKPTTVWKPSFAFQFAVDPYVELKMQAFVFTKEGRIVASGIAFSSQSKDWYYLRDSSLAIIADGQRYSFDSKHEGNVGSGLVFEHIAVPIPPDKLTSILKADVIEMRLGATEFKLKEKTIKDLRLIIPALSQN